MEYKINQPAVYSVATSDVSMAKVKELHNAINQISVGYLSIIRQYILPHIPQNIEIRIRELRFLECIHMASDAVTAHEIAETIGCDNATASRAISRLVKLEMVEQKRSYIDGREKLITLTGIGRKIAESLIRIEAKLQKTISDREDLKISFDECRQFLSISKKLLSRVSTINHTCMILDREFCRDCIRSGEKQPCHWLQSTAEC